MTDLIHYYNELNAQMRLYTTKYQRPDPVKLVAVSKSHSTESIAGLYQLSQQDFAESYLQEALQKISALKALNITWHFIGAIQTNKIPDIAQNFSWVQSVSRLKEAQLLSHHRMPSQPPLNICIQVKLDEDHKRAGIPIAQARDLLFSILDLPRLHVRGLMCLPPFTEDFDMQRKYFSLVRILFENLVLEGIPLDTLSMGMTHDFEAAIAEGATMIRIGTGLFGKRNV